MIPVVAEQRELVTGLRLDRDEFLRRWDDLPDLKNAELIDGVVYVASPVSTDHAEWDMSFGELLARYRRQTPGCRGGSNGTWMMLDSAPQPDLYLRVTPECGGRSFRQGKYLVGAPELAVEVTLSSTTVDHGSKLDLYRRAGVLEYVTLDLFSERIGWRVLRDGVYRFIEPDELGVIRSETFPGLWVSTTAFWNDDSEAVHATLDAGLASPEHAEFVRTLASRRR